MSSSQMFRTIQTMSLSQIDDFVDILISFRETTYRLDDSLVDLLRLFREIVIHPPPPPPRPNNNVIQPLPPIPYRRENDANYNEIIAQNERINNLIIGLNDLQRQIEVQSARNNEAYNDYDDDDFTIQPQRRPILINKKRAIGKARFNTCFQCSICLEDHKNGDSITTSCGHNYGKECWNRWMTQTNTNYSCPDCRAYCPSTISYSLKPDRKPKQKN